MRFPWRCRTSTCCCLCPMSLGTFASSSCWQQHTSTTKTATPTSSSRTVRICFAGLCRLSLCFLADYAVLLTYVCVCVGVCVCTVVASVGDVLDGWAARKLNQCSKFGEMLDVVVDKSVKRRAHFTFLFAPLRSPCVCVCLCARHSVWSNLLYPLYSFSRSLLWFFVAAAYPKWALLCCAIVTCEWCTFTCTHARYDRCPARCVSAARAVWLRAC